MGLASFLSFLVPVVSAFTFAVFIVPVVLAFLAAFLWVPTITTVASFLATMVTFRHSRFVAPLLAITALAPLALCSLLPEHVNLHGRHHASRLAVAHDFFTWQQVRRESCTIHLQVLLQV